MYGDFHLECKDLEGHPLWFYSILHFEIIHLEREAFQLKTGNMVTILSFLVQGVWGKPHLSKSHLLPLSICLVRFSQILSLPVPFVFTTCVILWYHTGVHLFCEFLFSFFFLNVHLESRVSERSRNWVVFFNMAGNLCWGNPGESLRLEMLLVSVSEFSELNLW